MLARYRSAVDAASSRLLRALTGLDSIHANHASTSTPNFGRVASTSFARTRDSRGSSPLPFM